LTKPWPIEEYQEPPDDTSAPEQPPVLVPAAVVGSVLETLNLLDEFFRDHASPTAQAELTAYAALHGWNPQQGAQLIIESVGLHTANLTRARNTTEPQEQ
jgi:hypothetical protein